MSSRFARKHDTREPKKIIRIYTEGTKTEPNYFNSIKNELRLNEIDIKIHGCGDHTIHLVEWVIAEKNSLSSDEESEWWAVFDKDDHSGYNEAIEKAETNGINVAYSNECFELWFILHFEFLNTAIGRDSYYDRLTTLLGWKYEKKNSDIYEIIKDKENEAMRSAKKLENSHSDSGVKSLEKWDPSTSVYKLVERLRSLST